MRHLLWVMVLGGLIMAAPAEAGFNLLDDFDGLEPGNIDAQQSAGGSLWDIHTETTNTQQVKPAPGGEEGDQALAFTGSSVMGSHVDIGDPPVPPHQVIADGQTGTVFFRLYMASDSRAFHWVTLTHVVGDIGTIASGALVQTGIALFNSSRGAPISVYDTSVGAPQQGEPLAEFLPDTWYNFWLVADNAADTCDIYMNTGDGPATEADLLVADTPFYPNRTTFDVALAGVFVRGGTGTHDLFMDHIYWDGAGVNLANPATGLKASDPSPANGATNVPVTTTTLSWSPPHDPENPGNPHPAIYQQDVWFSTSATDPTLELLATLGAGATAIDLGAYGKTPLQRDANYAWRVDTHLWINDPNMYEGADWVFQTEPSVPIITMEPENMLVGTGEPAQFAIEALNPFTGDGTGLGYQWYKAGAPDLALTDGADFTGTTTATLSVLDVQEAHEGEYYCVAKVISNNATTSSQSAILTLEKLMAHWSLDQADTVGGAYQDLSGNGHNADPNGVVQYVEGIVPPTASGAVLITEGTGWATAGTWDPSEISNQFTITGWARPDVSGVNSTILSKRESWGADVMRWTMRIGTGDQLQFFAYGNTVSSANTAHVGEWNHLAAVFDGAQLTVYLNGMPTGPADFVQSTQLDATVRIGHSDANIGQTFSGGLDEIAVYNYARSPEEIAAEYYTITGERPCLYPLDTIYDYNDDCQVDLLDLADFAANWLACGLYPACAQ